MKPRGHVIAPLLILAGLATTASAQFAETWVTPISKDCKTLGAGPQIIRFHSLALKNTGVSTVDLDEDGRYEGIAVATETEDGETTGNNTLDPIFETLATALTNTSAGGVIHLLPGVYREKVTITDSVILRGSREGDVIFQGACLATNGKAFDCTGTNKTVVFENITILGYDTGIDVNQNVVRVIDCEIADGAYGIESGTVLDVVGSSIHGCSTAGIYEEIGLTFVSDSVVQGNAIGIWAAGGSGVTVADSRLCRNTAEGLKAALSATSMAVDVHGGEVSGNGGRGVSYSGRNSGSIRLTDVLISGNGSDGVFIENDAGCVSLGTAALKSVVSNCRITGNVGDGIEVKGSGTSCTPIQPSLSAVSVFQNTIAFNGGYGLNGNNMNGAVVCTLGQNQIGYNTSTGENGTAQCTAAAASSNHVHN